MLRERAAAARRAEWAPLDRVNAYVGRCFRAAHRARDLATTGFGPDDARTWPLLERAAQVEREGHTVEAQLDAIMAAGRVG
jgi:hypothetical protein